MLKINKNTYIIFYKRKKVKIFIIFQESEEEIKIE